MRSRESRAAAEPFRVFIVEVARLRRLSPSFLRVTFSGADLDAFADNGFDQRIKLILPLPDSGLEHLPTGPGWHRRWRTLPAERRNPIRTYTARAVRPLLREVDVDVVLHGVGGPATHWANTTQPGDTVGLVGPDAAYADVHGGIEFHPPSHSGALLLAGDETTVPAIATSLERLPRDARRETLLEVPEPGDAVHVEAPPGMRVIWLARGGAPHGSLLLAGVGAAMERLPRTNPVGDQRGGALEDVDVDDELLWEVPTGPDGAHLLTTSTTYAWLAGEAGAIKALRRHLIFERGLDRRSVAFMGYWRLGRTERHG